MSDTRAQPRDRFEQLFADHYEVLLAYALRRATRDVAEDVVADAFVVVWRRLDDVPDDARPWLFGVARRVLADQRRGERRRAALRARLAQQPGDAPVTNGSTGLLAALARLPESDRELLLLVAWDGLAPVEAARALGLPRIALRVRLHRARKRLAAELKAEEAHDVAAVDLRVEEAR
jgi:RNA polymerase sigma-70 factor (ECF subfamily)